VPVRQAMGKPVNLSSVYLCGHGRSSVLVPGPPVPPSIYQVRRRMV
jgi:hypothetical protein